jgi:VWFA-related protein
MTIYSSIHFRRLSLFLLAPLFLGTSAWADTAGAAGAAAPASSSSEISVTLVEIPVEVRRGDDPVRGLTAADFVVIEEGRSLPIVAAEPIDLGGPQKPGAVPLPEAARRNLFLLFDFALSRPERLAQGIAAARELVARSLAPGDLVAVGIFLPKGDLPVLLNFTADRAAADRTLEALQTLLPGRAPTIKATADKTRTEEPDPLRLTGLGVRNLLSEAFRIDDRNFAKDMLGGLGAGDGSKGAFLIRNLLGHSSVLHQGSVDALQSDRVMALAETMAGLAETLRPVTGRKYMALFSEGFPMTLAYQATATTDATIGGSALLVRLDKALEELRHSGWVLHTVSLWGALDGLTADGLFFMAHETGGVLVEGMNKLAEGMDAAMRESAHSYLLTAQVDVAADGSYHPLEVRLRNSPAHTQIQAREGYFAPLPFRRQKDVQRLLEAARLVAGDEERNELEIQAVAVPLRSGAATTPVTVIVEIPGAPLLASGAASGARQLGLEVYGYALTKAGDDNSDYFAQAVSLDPAKVGPRLAQGGVRVLGQLNLPPGEHRLRVLVRDRGDGRLSLLTIPLSLTASTAAGGIGDPQARLDALFLPAPGDPWLLVRPADTVFDIHGRSVVPATQAALAAAGEAQIALLGRGFTSQGQWIRGRILTAEGKPAEGGSVELLTVSPGESGEPDLVLGRLRAGSLPAGDYMLELRMGQKTGAVQASAVRPFLIR